MRYLNKLVRGIFVNKEFFMRNRKNLGESIEEGIIVIFAGKALINQQTKPIHLHLTETFII